MFLRLLYESFRRQKRRKLLAGVAIMLGVGVATAMIAVATDIGDKISRELRTYGANLIVTPQEDTLDVQIGGINLKPPSDGAYLNEAGECEDHINAMRREVGLPVRTEYFFTRAYLKADANFNTRYVRLSFERRDVSQTKRYWLVWDAVSVGGLIGDSQRALVR